LASDREDDNNTVAKLPK
jgi:hypothetical protein